jgi:hypothetical protein
MEITCHRCHQTVLAENCYCPACGLPQLVYASDTAPGQAPAEPWNEPVRDAASVDWKPALRIALMLAVPAGLLSSGVSPMGLFGLLWMVSAAAWAVTLYVRGQRLAWITTGAGARIGLATGILAGWLAFSIGGGALFVQRYVLHQSSQIDAEWKTHVEESQQLTQQVTQQWVAGMGPADAAQAKASFDNMEAWMLSPEGHAGFTAFNLASNSVFLLFFAVGGGALGARLMARSRRPEA